MIIAIACVAISIALAAILTDNFSNKESWHDTESID
jgi:hypothetical protein